MARGLHYHSLTDTLAQEEKMAYKVTETKHFMSFVFYNTTLQNAVNMLSRSRINVGTIELLSIEHYGPNRQDVRITIKLI